MKKQLAAWLVLGLITVIAGLSLSMTNEVTKEPIRNQAVQAEAKAKQEVLPVAEAFEPVELPEDAEMELFAGMAGEDIVGYVGKVTVNGYGGPIDVIAGVDETGLITGINVGGPSFSETAGLGAKSREAAFTGQFVDKLSPIRVVKASDPKTASSVDAITAATLTSNAVVGGVNRIARQVSGILSPEEAPVVVAEGTTYTASQQGFAGPVAVFVTVKDDGTISQLKVGDDKFAESDGYGANALTEDFTRQFAGKSLPIALDDIEAISGATITTSAVITAINQAYEEKNVAAEPAAEGQEFAVQKQGFAGPVAVKVTIRDDGTISQLVIGDDQFAETEGYGAQALEPDFAKQFVGKALPVSKDDVDALSGATITTTAVIDALNEAFERFKAADGQASPEPEASEVPEETAAPTPVVDEADMKTAVKQGFESPVAVKVALNEDGSIKALIVGDDQFKETPGLGAKAQDEEFTSQFVGKVPPLALRKADEEASASTIDAVAAATITSQAVVDAVNEAVGVSEAPAPEVTTEPEAAAEPEAEADADVKTAVKDGFAGPVMVQVTLNEDGSIKELSVGNDEFKETPGLGAKAQDEEFTSQFAGKVPPLALRKADQEASASTIDAVAAATITSQAVVDAVNEAVGVSEVSAPEATEEPEATTEPEAEADADVKTAVKDGFAGPVMVRVTLNDDGSIKALIVGDDQFKETPGLGAKAQDEEFTSQFAGKVPPLALRKADEEASASTIDAVAAATITSQAVIDAVNEAVGVSEAPAPEVTTEPEATTEPETEEADADVKSAVQDGFAGPVEVQVTLNEDGSIKSLIVGNDEFKETPGLGAKAQDEEFTSQFAGKVPPLALRKVDEEASDSTIDAVAAATITSQAVVDAVNEAVLLAEDEPAAEAAEVYTAQAQGFESLVVVKVVFNADGSIKELTIGDEQFKETPGLGAKALEPEFAAQLIGKVPPLALRKFDQPAGKATIDAITAATLTSQAVVDAVNQAFEQFSK